jgi:hypothetical protein
MVLAGFSSFRFLRQSAAPHFVYQSKAWLEGRLDIDPEVLPNLEDWACVRVVDGAKVRCERGPQPNDRWYVSFPPFPAAVMLPFVALHGYQFNDTSFTVLCAALAVVLFYSLLRYLARNRETNRLEWENVLLSLVLAFGTVFFYCAIRGEVWFTAEVMGVLFTCLFIRYSVRAHHPFLAGWAYAMATLTRTPLAFAGVFFLMEALCPERGNRWAQFKSSLSGAGEGLRKLLLFAAGAAPLAMLAAAYNVVRFGKLGEFGHRFLFNNRVNADIDQYGLFHLRYLGRNLESAFLLLPTLQREPLQLLYSPWGMSLFLTFPLLVFLFLQGEAVVFGSRAALGAPVSLARKLFWPAEGKRLRAPLWAAVAACALPGFLYQNTGYMQFGFRFSLDYTPYLLLLFAVSTWSLKNRAIIAALALGFLVNFWGAAGFRGYTEMMRHW